MELLIFKEDKDVNGYPVHWNIKFKIRQMEITTVQFSNKL